eukprot:SAG31_NODE_30359_length_382_cov_0.876325_1_plen_94_part_01
MPLPLAGGLPPIPNDRRQSCPTGQTSQKPWAGGRIFRQDPTVFIDQDRDAIVNSDNGTEVHSFLKSLGVQHIMYVGAAGVVVRLVDPRVRVRPR